ncbi:hypothetical protein B1R32_101141 [Abditibacterium utsteinense]|uniref:DUF4440 domain-containing protein n=1 Tax=Abditibacterium utsteinense TaxID=1960156 RepID=A0A2S8SX71_9BACT|nr:nuclear transport factor 2 family protein [Abditibacterium utsteinense]PQV65401.1 hypothetical protein B1R32_101141 [Abditibacterium utsteinense]
MRKFFPILALLILVVGGVLLWRWTHPKLSDEEQIAANLNGICEGAKARSPRAITDYLSKDFKAGDTTKSELQNSLVAGILQYRVIDLKISSVKTSVLRASLGEGVTASSEGQFLLSLKSEYNSQPQIQTGKFDLKWRKIDGEWKVITAQGELPQF